MVGGPESGFESVWGVDLPKAMLEVSFERMVAKK